MHLSRITIENFRNFQSLDVALGGNLVIVGENRVGKSNLLYALRLIFDPSLPDSSRQLGRADFWESIIGVRGFPLPHTRQVRRCPRRTPWTRTSRGSKARAAA